MIAHLMKKKWQKYDWTMYCASSCWLIGTLSWTRESGFAQIVVSIDLCTTFQKVSKYKFVMWTPFLFGARMIHMSQNKDIKPINLKCWLDWKETFKIFLIVRLEETHFYPWYSNNWRSMAYLISRGKHFFNLLGCPMKIKWFFF